MVTLVSIGAGGGEREPCLRPRDPVPAPDATLVSLDLMDDWFLLLESSWSLVLSNKLRPLGGLLSAPSRFLLLMLLLLVLFAGRRWPKSLPLTLLLLD